MYYAHMTGVRCQRTLLACVAARAEHLMRIRYKPWPKVVEFLEALDDGAWVADVGCGNGKLIK